MTWIRPAASTGSPEPGGTGPSGSGDPEAITKVAVGAYVKGALTLKEPRTFLFFPRERGQAGRQGSRPAPRSGQLPDRRPGECGDA